MGAGRGIRKTRPRNGDTEKAKTSAFIGADKGERAIRNAPEHGKAIGEENFSYEQIRMQVL